MDCMIDVICCVFRESHLLPRTQLSHKKIDHSSIWGHSTISVQILPVVRRLLGESSCEVLEIRYTSVSRVQQQTNGIRINSIIVIG